MVSAAAFEKRRADIGNPGRVFGGEWLICRQRFQVLIGMHGCSVIRVPRLYSAGLAI